MTTYPSFKTDGNRKNSPILQEMSMTANTDTQANVHHANWLHQAHEVLGSIGPI
jgi:hypothetical protein